MLARFLICTVPAFLITIFIYTQNPNLNDPGAAHAANNSADPKAQQNLRTQINILRSQVELYKLQHADNYPDFKNQGWSQLLARTNSRGQPATGQESFGPYLQRKPVNVLNDSSEILVA